MSGSTRAQLTGLVVSAILVVIGIVIVVVVMNPLNGGGATAFGWFAYQPLANAVFVPGNLVVLTPSMMLGTGLTVLGLLGLAFLLGLRLGTRSSTARS